MKSYCKRILRKFGYELYRPELNVPVEPDRQPGGWKRPIGRVASFLEDIRQRGVKPRGILDIGANTGEWTRMAKSINPESTILMIEPQSHLHPLLQQLCNELPMVDLAPVAVGRSSGELVQEICDDPGASHFYAQSDSQKIESGKQVLTSVRTVDELLAERPDFHPDLVKIDTQGFELEVLGGASSLFGKAEVIIMETSLFHFWPNAPLVFDCMHFMHTNDYVLYDITDWGRRPYDGALGQVDFAFVQRDGQLRQSHEYGTWKREIE